MGDLRAGGLLPVKVYKYRRGSDVYYNLRVGYNKERDRTDNDEDGYMVQQYERRLIPDGANVKSIISKIKSLSNRFVGGLFCCKKVLRVFFGVLYCFYLAFVIHY